MTKEPMTHEQMSISEKWRWRLLTCWIIFFTCLVAYGLFEIRNITADNRDALCSIHAVHRGEQSILGTVSPEQRDFFEPLLDQIKAEEAVLSHLKCDF